jgi:alpha-ribazole phosphatase/probable phosphoglycerate mutase
MNRLILIRHPATELAGTFCGHSDPDLDAAGHAQLQALQHRLASVRFDRLLSSDLLRARRCAEALAQPRGIRAELRAGLREMHFGAWEALRWPDVEARFPAQARRWLDGFATFTPPDAEPYAHFTARIHQQVSEWLQDASSATLAVVTHRGVLLRFLQSYCGLEPAVAWQQTCHYASVLFCVPTPSGESPFAIDERWHPD